MLRLAGLVLVSAGVIACGSSDEPGEFTYTPIPYVTVVSLNTGEAQAVSLREYSGFQFVANEIEAVVEREDTDKFEQWASEQGFVAVPNDLNALAWRVYNVQVPDGAALDAVEYARAAPGVVSTNTIVMAPVQGD